MSWRDYLPAWPATDTATATESAPRSDDQSLVGNQEVQARAGVGSSEPGGGTYVVKPGESLAAIAKRGTGDPMRYRELNTANGRDPEDASLEPGDILRIPAGWDLAAVGAVAEAAPTTTGSETPEVESDEAWDPYAAAWGVVDAGASAIEQAASTVDQVDQAVNPMRWAREAAAAKATEAYRAWMAGPEATEMRASHEASEQRIADSEENQGAREDQAYLKRDETGALVGQTVDADDAGADATLELAETRAELGDEDSHYKKEGATKADKEAQSRGDAERDTFWCSGLSLWTLGAAGYDLMSPLTGSNGMAHSYVDDNGYTPILGYMLVDGQQEAVHAAGQILKFYGQKPFAEIPGVCVDIRTNEIRNLEGVEGVKAWKQLPAMGPDEEAVQAASTEDVDFGTNDTSLFQEGTYDETEAGEDYEDSWAVMGAPGAFEMMGIGSRVESGELKPGDFAQAWWKSPNDKYTGLGHGWQIWSVKVRGSAWFGVEGSPKLVDGTEITTKTWLADVEFEVDKDTLSSLVANDTELISFKAIEANTAGAADTDLASGGDGGVDITEDRTVGTQTKRNPDKREYYGRLHESPWSEANWRPASAPGAEEPEQEEEQEAEEGGGSGWMEWMFGG